jgi:hypothetical protein
MLRHPSIATLVTLTFLIVSCSPAIISSRSPYEIDELETESPDSKDILKIYYKNGDLAILRGWQIDNDKRIITGRADVYNSKRRQIAQNSTTQISFDECTLLETNDYEGYNVISPLLMTVTVLTGLVTIPCIGDPKACFGSCPTFYLHQDDSLIVQAEGFSSSITRSLEEEDVDYLPAFDPLRQTKNIRIELKNEAYETHYVRKASLVAIERKPNETVYFHEGAYYTGTPPVPALTVNDSDSLLHSKLAKADREEYLSQTDSLDLTTQESITLTFAPFDGSSAGIVITQRQSLLTTFLFYQSMAFMGTQLGTIMAAYENASPLIRSAQKDMYDILGGVEVSVLVKGKWKSIGRISEQGPIVNDRHMLPTNIAEEITKVKLTMTKGLWQIDQVGVVELYETKQPHILKPIEVINNNVVDNNLLKTLNDPDSFLVNNPGTSLTLVYHLPDNAIHDLFINTEGYYTEWMRAQWLLEEDYEMTKMILYKPEKWLKLMSPAYKQVELEMNELFWQSKFGYNEN